MDAEPKIPTAIEGLETFTLSGDEVVEDEEKDDSNYLDADSFFSLPDTGSAKDEDEDEAKS